MENKINLVELLKDCPKGMELDCVLYEDVTFECILDGSSYPIQVQTLEGKMILSEYGCLSLSKHAKCVIFPKGKTTWEGFVPPCKFKDGDIVVTKTSNNFIFYSIYKCVENREVQAYVDYNLDSNKLMFNDTLSSLCFIDEIVEQRLATEEEKEKLFQAIEDNGYEWNAETKTLEKVPEFKFEDEYLCELVPNKFDINTLKPFDKVLVRGSDNGMWCASIFSHTWIDRYFCVGTWHNQCIPYEGNEHLLGTTKNCDEYYKTWG